MIKEMYVPPPLEILRRKYTNKEPIRTGFNQGLLPINIRNNVELKRAPQGPQIVITSQAQKMKHERDIKSRETSTRGGKRSVSRESSMDQLGSNLKDKDRAQSRNEALRAKGESKEKTDDEQEKI